MTEQDFADYLAPGYAADDVPELTALAAARPVVGTFISLFRGSEAEVLLRLLVLREIGHDADSPRWSPDALRRRFAYLDAVKLETVLKRLREHDLLRFGDDGHYHLSDPGRNAVAALGMLLRFDDAEDAELGFLTAQLAGLQATGSVNAEALGHLLSKLNDLSLHFEDAIASGSEFRIVESRQRLSANGKWLDRGTEILRQLLADPDASFDVARIAQRIGLAQSRLARVDAAFQRALNKIETQRVTLGSSGVSSSDVGAWLRRQDADALVAMALGAITDTPDLRLLAGGHELLDRAEVALCDIERNGAAQAEMPPPDTAPPADRPEEEDLRLLTHFTSRLAALDEAAPLHALIAGGGFHQAAYRLSLLAMLADTRGASEDGPVGQFLQIPMDVHFDDTLVDVGSDEIARMSRGEVRPRPSPSHD
ncbi:hypothetical protein G3580_09465 [Nitrogeniibacter mangrovi]|uniref:Uncharacterized protein n=1 Tax=Nitrogeniibacter mangrovi TaxID=2016596 RepID=A0A6C1B4C3_9RHOO|nr:hypothetical protein [Nitrogeniibacter mangrovi]QID17849.1 hypothetical protein G3580_09465 [Nitrogeniibacter mangrovi]